MSNLKRIKVIKHQNPGFLLPSAKPEGTTASEFHTRKSERELAQRVNDWVFDWRNRKREREIKDYTAFLSKGV